MGAIKRTHSLKKVNGSWNIPLNTFSNHLNGKTKSRNMGPRGVAKLVNDQRSEDNRTNDEVNQNQY